MRKDYMPIAPGQTGLDELTRVEQHWTGIWQQQHHDPAALVRAVMRREEYRIMQPYLAQMRAEGGERILDAGCGLGEWTMLLTDQGYDVYGVDVSRATIAWLASHFAGYRFLCGDIRHLGFPNSFFDACFSWGVFEHFEVGLEPCISEAWRVLRPGGYLFISVPFQNWRHTLRDMRPLHRWQEPYAPQQGYTTPMRFYQWRLTIPELERELAMRGFRVLQVQPVAQQHGLKRTLQHDFGMVPGRPLYRLLHAPLAHLVPAPWVSHMLMAVAQKREESHVSPDTVAKLIADMEHPAPRTEAHNASERHPTT
jgi:SAM-dependent methyltransferase